MQKNTAIETGKNIKFDLEFFRKKLGLPLAIILGVGFMFIKTPEGLSYEGHKAIALFISIFILYLTEAIPLAVTSLAIFPMITLLKLGTPTQALSGMSSTSTYLIIGSFILSAAMVKSNLAKRITYMILTATGVSSKKINAGITLANITLAFLVPSTTARTAILLPVCVALIKEFGGGIRNNFSIGLLLNLAFTNATISAGIFTATVPNPLAADMLSRAGGATIGYAEWFKAGFPPAVIMTFITWWFIQKVFKSNLEGDLESGRKMIEKGKAELGSIKIEEIKALIVFAFIVTLWVTASQTKINATMAVLMGSIFLFMPKIGFLDWKDAYSAINWNIALLCGGGISLSAALDRSGAAKWIGQAIFDSLGLSKMSFVMMLVVLLIVVQFMHFFFVGTSGMTTGFVPIIIGVAQAANVPAVSLVLPAVMIIGGYPLMMFYCTNPNVLVYGTDLLKVEDFPKVGIPLSIMACILYGITAFTYWTWIGLF